MEFLLWNQLVLTSYAFLYIIYFPMPTPRLFLGDPLLLFLICCYFLWNCQLLIVHLLCSGMLVQDPTKGGHDIDALFDQARQMGATQGPFEHQPSSSSRSFTGTGRLLSGETVPAAPRPPENVIHNIFFWNNGFTVGNGPLRRFDDPANTAFLEVCLPCISILSLYFARAMHVK